MLYSSVYPEIHEREIWDAGKHDEARQLNSLINFNLLAHFLTRNVLNLGMPERNTANNKMKIRIIKALTD